jgi:capsular polysaccharide biosynthesis protein
MRLWKNERFIAFVIALVTVAGGFVVWNWYHPKFRAHARLLVAAHPPAILFKTGETDVDLDYTRFKSTQQALVKSQLVLNAALMDKNVSKYRIIRDQIDPIAWLQDNLEVAFVQESEVMEIALSGDESDEVAGVVNAVKKAYMDEVVNVDTKRRADRHAKLRKIKDEYGEALHERRKRLRQLNESALEGDRLGLAGLERSELLSLYNGLWTKRVEIQLQRAEAETELKGHPRDPGAGSDGARTEIKRIEGQLAGLAAQQTTIDERLEQMAKVIRNAAIRALDLESLKIEITQLEDTSRKVAAEVEALNVELSAPPRVRTIEDAVPPLTRSRESLWGRLTSR